MSIKEYIRKTIPYFVKRIEDQYKPEKLADVDRDIIYQQVASAMASYIYVGDAVDLTTMTIVEYMASSYLPNKPLSGIARIIFAYIRAEILPEDGEVKEPDIFTTPHLQAPATGIVPTNDEVAAIKFLTLENFRKMLHDDTIRITSYLDLFEMALSKACFNVKFPNGIEQQDAAKFLNELILMTDIVDAFAITAEDVTGKCIASIFREEHGFEYDDLMVNFFKNIER